ncbi:hypothetical protein SAICODRAFT_129812 [Saitoella complicata NRRL Y-17804]|uniref:Uncharacterized protein n=1 Tax=Saitoella complicata (strain BCRC 22490 / CBS 7301 / JCM 7358 / NBRC 10748 / NRRL Y-17804) TaxID=698492 RepID=A0A0E9NKU7_SAICN|nr:uncharacterized protein SAICODRAFT_129812 [Saitoella complicata NRRL Y-17804]ODQ52506.1 hypothetical protein SAICODRAFT_129812 [Saitoella complicata NRRL Y-17804]GAO50459.1 hypothetical protein G7K_4583-t1 [Saitoella complicata NRRL Y-17804]
MRCRAAADEQKQIAPWDAADLEELQSQSLEMAFSPEVRNRLYLHIQCQIVFALIMSVILILRPEIILCNSALAFCFPRNTVFRDDYMLSYTEDALAATVGALTFCFAVTYILAIRSGDEKYMVNSVPARFIAAALFITLSLWNNGPPMLFFASLGEALGAYLTGRNVESFTGWKADMEE